MQLRRTLCTKAAMSEFGQSVQFCADAQTVGHNVQRPRRQVICHESDNPEIHVLRINELHASSLSKSLSSGCVPTTADP